jgi:hypothetical protein
LKVSYSTLTYQLALEEEFLSVDSGYTNYTLAVKTGSHVSGSEAFNAQIWNGGSWTTIITGLSWSSWNNVSVTAYKDATMYVRFIGQTETGDGTQDSFNIDCILVSQAIKIWNEAGGPAILVFMTPVDTAGLDGLILLAGLIMIPVSTIYLVHGGRDDLDWRKLYLFLIVFCIGWALFLGGITP